ncbi:methyltransferase domain-containing protein [Methanomethylovorans sp.]|jgi:hypothetical protein|uniref:methyltransferase domain-containing protein n=1 Tax=Methanomethylovorans sp. TaxID=2758717 RepID=UPI002FDE0211
MTLRNIEPRKAFLIKHYKENRILNVGSGGLYLKNAINIDMNALKKPDIRGDFHHLPFKDKSFDVAFALDIIEHTETPEILLNELERVSNNVIVECLDFDLCPANWTDDKTHVYYINRKTMKEILSPRGYNLFHFVRLHLEGEHFRKSMLVGVRKPKLFDKQMFLLISAKHAFTRFLEKV